MQRSLTASVVLALLSVQPVSAQRGGATGASSSQPLVIARSGSQPSTTGSATTFTGSVRIDPLFGATEYARARGSTVTFALGARTAWHTHPQGQVLIVTSGTGRVQRWGASIGELRPGDVVRIPPNVKHWHGAAPTAPMTHIAIVEGGEGRVVEWMEHVTDEQYRAPVVGSQNVAQNQGGGRGARGRASGDTVSPGSADTTRIRSRAEIAPMFTDLTDRILYGEVWRRPGLSQRDRSLVTVSALVALNRPDQLRAHLSIARSNGVTEEELMEALTHLAFYSGWPSAVTAIDLARQIFVRP